MNKPRSLIRLSPLALVAAGSLTLIACGGQTAFSGKVPLVVPGDAPPPPPPPPPPKKKEEPKPPPRVELRDNKIEITEKIQFEVAKAIIKPESFGLLDEIVGVIKANPHIKKLAIEGHASSEGDPKANKKLSDDRAKAVRQYLVDHGIAADMLTAKGFGSDKPIASNDTDEGKEKNRRVEFNVVEQDVTKKKVEIDPTTGKEKVVDTQTETSKKEEAADDSKESDKDEKKKPAVSRPKKK
jgi:OOP family OmpA-OmpF porin